MRIIYLHPISPRTVARGAWCSKRASVLVARGHHVDCVCIRADDVITGDDAGIRFHEICGPLSSQISVWMRFRESCQRVCATVERLSLQSLNESVLFPQVFPANWWGSYVINRQRTLPCVWYCHEPSAFIHSKKCGSVRFLGRKNWIAQALTHG